MLWNIQVTTSFVFLFSGGGSKSDSKQDNELKVEDIASSEIESDVEELNQNPTISHELNDDDVTLVVNQHDKAGLTSGGISKGPKDGNDSSLKITKDPEDKDYSSITDSKESSVSKENEKNLEETIQREEVSQSRLQSPAEHGQIRSRSDSQDSDVRPPASWIKNISRSNSPLTNHSMSSSRSNVARKSMARSVSRSASRSASRSSSRSPARRKHSSSSSRSKQSHEHGDSYPRRGRSPLERAEKFGDCDSRVRDNRSRSNSRSWSRSPLRQRKRQRSRSRSGSSERSRASDRSRSSDRSESSSLRKRSYKLASIKDSPLTSDKRVHIEGSSEKSPKSFSTVTSHDQYIERKMSHSIATKADCFVSDVSDSLSGAGGCQSGQSQMNSIPLANTDIREEELHCPSVPGKHFEQLPPPHQLLPFIAIDYEHGKRNKHYVPSCSLPTISSGGNEARNQNSFPHDHWNQTRSSYSYTHMDQNQTKNYHGEYWDIARNENEKTNEAGYHNYRNERHNENHYPPERQSEQSKEYDHPHHDRDQENNQNPYPDQYCDDERNEIDYPHDYWDERNNENNYACEYRDEYDSDYSHLDEDYYSDQYRDYAPQHTQQQRHTKHGNYPLPGYREVPPPSDKHENSLSPQRRPFFGGLLEDPSRMKGYMEGPQNMRFAKII